MYKWDDIYLMLVGELEEVDSMSGAEDYSYSEMYEAAHESIVQARNRLCKRFGIDPEDSDLEQIISAVLQIEKDISRRAFLYGIACAGKREG